MSPIPPGRQKLGANFASQRRLVLPGTHGRAAPIDPTDRDFAQTLTPSNASIAISAALHGGGRVVIDAWVEVRADSWKTPFCIKSALRHSVLGFGSRALEKSSMEPPRSISKGQSHTRLTDFHHSP